MKTKPKGWKKESTRHRKAYYKGKQKKKIEGIFVPAYWINVGGQKFYDTEEMTRDFEMKLQDYE